MSSIGDRVVDLHIRNPDWDYVRIAAEASCPAPTAYHVLALHRAGIRHAPTREGEGPRRGGRPARIGPLVIRLREANPDWTHERIKQEVRVLMQENTTVTEASVKSVLYAQRRREREALAATAGHPQLPETTS